jgi:hypothetical protein
MAGREAVMHPGYWRDGQGGELVPAMHRYLDGLPLSIRDIALIRLYIQQWIDAEVWDTNPAQTDEGRLELAELRGLARGLSTRRAITAWIERAEDLGLDPL